MGSSSGSVHKTEEEWRAILSPEQFRILRQKGTDNQTNNRGREGVMIIEGVTNLISAMYYGWTGDISFCAILSLHDFFWDKTVSMNRLRGTGEYDKVFQEGVYNCAGCGTPLYKSTTKFNSGCGWPAFYEGFPGAINRTPDPDGRRTEITCAACGGHLGHVFKGEGFSVPTDERHCVNSVSIKFVPADATSSL
uniref:MsrB domain-containing protein n=2 Tax=Gossypium raimondii TaxID=29730 RepID=A0A0D2NYL3_GOSRA|nr:hypothetical protein B456_006G256100 [Gossypium raimondii]